MLPSTCYLARTHVCKFQFVRFSRAVVYHNAAFLIKLSSILRLYFLLISRSKRVDSTQSSVHPRPKSSPRVGFIPWPFDRRRERSSGETKTKLCGTKKKLERRKQMMNWRTSLTRIARRKTRHQVNKFHNNNNGSFQSHPVLFRTTKSYKSQ